MHLSTAITFVNVAGLVAAHPMQTLFTRDVTNFTAGMRFDILLDKGNDGKTNIKPTDAQNVQVIDIDLFTTSKEMIQDLKSTMKVICYFSAGSKENGRPDTGSFTAADSKKELDGWPGEFWLDVKSENVHNIMKKRIDLAVENGCDAVDPDNVDGYGKDKGDKDKRDGESNDGFNYPKSAYADYVKLLADYANHHKVRPIAMGLKNAIELFQEYPDVLNAVQFAVNEQCRLYNECGSYKAFTDVNKAVFNIEYNATECSSLSNGALLSTVNKPDTSLTTLGGTCDASDNNGNQPPATPTYVANPTGGKSTVGPYSTVLPTQHTGSPTGAASKPTPTKAQGEDKDSDDNDANDDNSDNGDKGDGGDDNDDNEATSTRAGGRPTGHPGWAHGKGQKGQGRHSHSSSAASATPTPTDE